MFGSLEREEHALKSGDTRAENRIPNKKDRGGKSCHGFKEGKIMRRCLQNRAHVGMFLCVCLVVFATGCATPILVNSEPPGARVIHNSVNTGLVTPTKFTVRKLPVGRHTVNVEKEGYRTVTPPQSFRIRVSPMKIVGTVLLAIVGLPVELAGDLWKDASDLPVKGFRIKYVLETFHLEALDAATVVTNKVSPAMTSKGQMEKPDSLVDRLRELKKLHDDDILTDEEYETRRKALVDQLR